MILQEPIKTELSFLYFDWPDGFKMWERPLEAGKCIMDLSVGPPADYKGNWYRPSKEIIEFVLRQKDYVEVDLCPPRNIITLTKDSIVFKNDLEFQIEVEKLVRLLKGISVRRQELRFGLKTGDGVIADINGKERPALVEFERDPTGVFFWGLRIRMIKSGKPNGVLYINETGFEKLRKMTDEEKHKFLPEDHPDVSPHADRY